MNQTEEEIKLRRELNDLRSKYSVMNDININVRMD
jgi:hypothetical protein